MRPTYYFTSDEWYKIPEDEKIIIREEQSRYKRSRRNYGGTLINEITPGGNSIEQDSIRTIQQRIPAIESNADGQLIATGSIMGGRNEQADLISRNNNQCNDGLVRSVKVKRVNSQVTTNGYYID